MNTGGNGVSDQDKFVVQLHHAAASASKNQATTESPSEEKTSEQSLENADPEPSLNNEEQQPTEDAHEDEEDAEDPNAEPEEMSGSLFGHYDTWKEVRSAKRELGELVAKGKYGKPKTIEAKKLCKEINQLSDWYENHGIDGNDIADAATEEERKQFFNSLEKLMSTYLQNGRNKLQKVKELYFFVAPLYVDLLHLAISRRSGAWTEEVSLPQLKEVMGLFQTFVSLGITVPDTSKDMKLSSKVQAIERPFKRTILPCCKRLQDMLKEEYRLQDIHQSHSPRVLARQRGKWLESRERTTSAQDEEIMERRSVTAEAVAALALPRKPRLMEPCVREPSPPPVSKAAHTNAWTFEEDDELIIQLAYWSELPSTTLPHS